MAEIVESMAADAAADAIESLADKAMQKLHYLCCYNRYVEDFEEQKISLSARRNTLRKDIQEAKDRNENQIESEVELWLGRAEDLINEDTKEKKKWFGLVPNCFWRYKRGKDLEDKKQKIKALIEKSNFTRVARSTGLPGIEFYSTENFLQLKDRKLQFEQLTEALKNDNKFVIGLCGLGGTGKTTMAKVVGKKVAESKVFGKVIFSVISQDPNLKKIRDNIAKQLNLDFKGADEFEQAQELWKRISGASEKVLLILDDVWEMLSLEKLGIPHGRHGNSCSILLTACDWKVCRDMGCHQTVKLELLNDQDAVELFLSYAGQSIDDSSNDFKDVALDIVKDCGRLPVAIVAVARALNSRPLIEWKQGLKRLQNHKSIHDVNEDLKEACNSLRLSYDYLKNEEARKLFLLCSLFPEDYEIPIELLTRIAIGVGLCGGANTYFVARSFFSPIIYVLMDSWLLLKAENEAVKMHDLVREVALRWIGKNQVQVGMDSSTTLMDNIQYSSWNIDNFPSHFDGRNLEVLFLWVSNAVKVPDGIFKGMEKLKILALMNRSNIGILGASLFQSHTSLINVRSLTIKGFELGDISFLVNLKSLESLELKKCSMIELPQEIRELEKLRLLEIVECVIQRNNPFEVIESCFQLEELYFVSNRMDKACELERYQITTFPKLERYQIKAWSGFNYDKVDFSISGYFDLKHLRVNFSNEMFKSLVARAKVLNLGGDYCNRGWTNVVPDILPVKDDNMEDHLTRLCLESMNGIKCLILTKHLRYVVAIFSKLVELELSQMDVRELCCGPYPVNFLKQLEKLHLSQCTNLEGSLFDRKLELCNLKSIFLFDCSMTCIFYPSTAQSLKQLEMLDIKDCFGLKYIVAEPMEDHDSMFPKLKYLKVSSCPELKFILPICFCKDLPLLARMEIVSCEKLEYIFGLYPDEGDLHQMGKEPILRSLEELKIAGVPKFINLYAECYLPCPCSGKAQKSSPSTNVEDCTSSLSRGLLCFFWLKSNASTMDHPSTSTNHKEAMNRAHGLFTPPLFPYTLLRRLHISKLVGLKSLFTLSVASSLNLLEILEVRDCDTLEHVVTDKEDDHDHMNVNSIFPNLQKVEVFSCGNLEYLFPAFYSKDLKDLKSVQIEKAEKLTHVFGKCQADQDHNVYIDLNLRALKRLYLSRIPNEVSICAQNYSMKDLYLEDIILDTCPQVSLETLIDSLVVGHKRHEYLSRIKALPPLEERGKLPYNLQELPEFKEPKSYMCLQNLSKLSIRGYKQLRCIFSASTSRGLQKLRELEVKNCEELVSIIEDQENNKSPIAPHQVLFPELRTIEVRDCKSIEYLFSISSGKLPRLFSVDIEDTPQLGEVFRWNHGEGQKLVMEDVFPKLCMIRLVNLPTLHTMCQGMDFHTVKYQHVHKCPAISLTSTNDSCKEHIPLLKSFQRKSVHEDEEFFYVASTLFQWQCKVLDELLRATYTLENRISPNSSESEEVSNEIAEEDSTTNSNLPNLTKSTKTSANEIVEEKLSMTPSSDLDKNLKATFGEGPSEKYGKASSLKLCGKESMDADQQAHGESTSSNEAPQRTEEPTKEWSSKETSNEVSLKIRPPSVTEMTSAMNLKATFGEGPALEKYGKASSSMLRGKESMDDHQQAHGESRSSNEAPQRIDEPTKEWSSKETSNEVSLNIPSPSVTDMTSAPDPSIFTLKKPPTAISTTHTEPKSSQSDIFDTSINTECPQVEIMTNDKTCTDEEEMKFDEKSSSQIFEEHDLMRLFQMTKEGVDMEVDLSYVSKLIVDLHHNKEVIKALADLEASLKKGLNEIACSKESRLRLQNALNMLSSHCSEDGASSHGLQDTIQSLQQEIQTVLSSFNQAYATIDTFTKLEQKEKLMIEQRSQREKDAKTLLYDINTTKNSIDEVQLNEAELKEQISKLQAELRSKEEEIQKYKRKLLSLQEQEKKSVSDTIGFTMEFLAMEKERSSMVADQMKARQQLENMDDKWSSCLSNLKKTMMLLGVHLKQKL